MIEGIGNKYSDIDVYILTDLKKIDGCEYNEKYSKTAFFTLNGKHFDIEYWDKGLIHELIRQSNENNLSDLNIRSYNLIKIENLSFKDMMSFIHRFNTGYPIYNANEFDKYKNELNIAYICKFASRAIINKVDAIYEDIIGCVEEKELDSAVLSCKIQILELMRAYIFSFSETIDRSKWIIKRLELLGEKSSEASKIHQEFRNLYFGSALSKCPSELNSYIEKSLEFTNKVIDLIAMKNCGI
ncbi:hypothetical protein Aargi30884_17420 [Amedibacterium intestinale]|uniref:Nucleotidyltransferase n=1 Tax=Amedibacterium intestinale TaxID=2583452 RepID=A0A6N4TJA7_9FIRM|nr:hypothetical protein [Amedibacterium intestinale]BBK22839.1 hypothetical protein Aargi30884_17420 [Amedibacterium intestinale]